MPGKTKRANNAPLLTDNPEKRLFNIVKERGEKLNGTPRIIKLDRPKAEVYQVTYKGYGFEIAHQTQPKGYTFWPLDGYKGIGTKEMLDILLTIKI